MTVLIPNAKIAARWNGALQARLRYAPLEAYAVTRGLKWAVSGQTRITDNLACITMYILGEAITVCAEAAPAPLEVIQHPIVGQIACAVTSNLALLIQEPSYWRTGALVATARTLEKYIGLSAAAHIAAAAAREYSTDLKSCTPDPEVLHIGHAARDAVASNRPADTDAVVRLIVHHLAARANRQRVAMRVPEITVPADTRSA